MDEKKPKKPVGRPFKDAASGYRVKLNAKVSRETKIKLSAWQVMHGMSQGEVVDAWAKLADDGGGE